MNIKICLVFFQLKNQSNCWSLKSCEPNPEWYFQHFGKMDKRILPSRKPRWRKYSSKPSEHCTDEHTKTILKSLEKFNLNRKKRKKQHPNTTKTINCPSQQASPLLELLPNRSGTVVNVAGFRVRCSGPSATRKSNGWSKKGCGSLV